jgi:hypothetical protein
MNVDDLLFIPFRYCDPVEAAAFYGVPSHGVVSPSSCPAGYYCPANTSSAHESPCPAGTFSNETNMYAEKQCTPCTGGYYCGSLGKISILVFI